MTNPTEKIKEVEKEIEDKRKLIHDMEIAGCEDNQSQILYRKTKKQISNLKAKLQVYEEWEKDNKKNNERLKNILYKLNFIEQKIKGEK